MVHTSLLHLTFLVYIMKNNKAIKVFQIYNIEYALKTILPPSLLLQEADMSPKVGTVYIFQSPVSPYSSPWEWRLLTSSEIVTTQEACFLSSVIMFNYPCSKEALI